MIEAATPRVSANPAGNDVTLSAAQVWQALLWKAEFAHLFVKPIKRCTVLQRFDDGFLREILHEDSQGQEVLYERIFFVDQKTVRFLRLNGSVGGEIVNTIRTEPELSLDFSFTLALAGEKHGSAKELQYEKDFLAGYVIAAESTLEAARGAVRTGIDPTREAAAAAR